MNSPHQPAQPLQKILPVRGKWRQRKGVALILVVSFIVLMSALVVGFFSRVTTELTGARTYAESISARQLAESAVSIVMGQIRAATTITNGCWASQPGMIRVYGGANGAAGTQAYQFFKLYSSHNLVVKGSDLATFDPYNTQPGKGARTEVPIGTGGWQAQPAFFTDLNEPAEITAFDPATGQTIIDSSTGKPKVEKRYPIFDPSVALIYNSASSRPNNPNWTGKVEGSEIALSPTDRQVNDAPMPVRWIYVLKDGTLTAPTPLTGVASGITGLKAVWNNLGSPQATPSIGVPSKSNPIVGRIAFWTDDDTCKVNINTAGGHVVNEPANPDYRKPSKTATESNPAFIPGSFWDTPRVQTYFDSGISGPPEGQPSTAPYHYPASQSLGGINHFRAGLASSQPVRNEFQRYPGHPSTTSLGLALKGLMDSGSSSGKILTSELLYMMTPRLMPGSSQGGTKQLLKYDAQVDPAIYGLTPDPPAFQKKTFDSGNLTVIDPTTGNPVPNPSFHLYSSLDEMYYTTLNKPDTSYPTILKNTVQNNPDGTRVTADKALNLKNVITPAMIDKMRFVLTTHSRSPELNLFGRPRVTIWPIPTKRGEQRLLDTMDFDTKKQGIRNPSDDLFQFCSTVGADPNPPKDPTLTNPNGPIRQGQFIFDRLDPYSSTKDFERTRNRAIFNYLLDVTSNSKGRIPGWGLSFEGKYAGLVGGHIQILTEIFDYIRSVNLKDTSRDQRIDRSQGRKNSGAKKNDNAENLKLEARYAPRGIVVPTRTTVNGANVSGFGRFPTVSEVSLVFYCGGYVYKKRGGDGKPTGPDLVEYDFTKVDERNIITGNAADVFFKNNVLTHKLMRAFLIIETFNPMQGYGPVTALSSANKERIVYEITSDPGFSVTSTSMTAPEPLNLGYGKCNVSLSSGDTWAGRNFGGTEGFFHTMDLKTSTNPGTNTAFVTNHYPFQTPCLVPTDGIRVPIDDTEFKFTGGKMTLTISYKDAPANGNKLPSHDELVQTLKLDWRPGEGWPVPITEREAGRWLGLNGSDWKAKLTTYYGAGKYSGEGFRQTSGGFDKGAPGFNADDTNANFPGHNNEKWSTAFAAHPGYAMAYSLPGRLLWSHRHSWSPWVGVNNTLNNGAGVQVSNGKNYADRFKQIVQPGDTIRSLQPGNDKLPEGTDLRTMHLQKTVEFETFKPHPDYFVEAKSDPNPNISRRAQTLRTASGAFYFPPTDPVWFPNADNDKKKAPTGLLLQLPGGARYLTNSAPDLPRGVTALQQDHTKAADFDTGIGSFPDGAFAGKADEGNVARSWLDEFSIWNYVEPYFTTWAYDSPGDTYFSPNRQIPSPVMFGSLPAPNTSKFDNAGWKTLLFCPNPASRGKSVTEPFNPSIHHHGFKSPPDHLLLDLFNMPVVEPYAISEPFSTDGKVNLNYQLMPFGYIERSTALRAALHPLRVTAIPSGFTRSNAGVEELVYKGVDNDENLRYLVDRDETLKGFKAFFAKFGPGHTETGFFKSGSQICEMFLYPKGRPISKKNTERAAVTFKAGDTDIIQWWKECALTGDNVREKPYSDLYSRVTTKSNTYTVHYRVQSLRQQPYSGNPTSAVANTYYETWDESRDKVLSEYRGHTTIERYLDPRDSRFTFTSTNPAAPAINPETQSLESAYRFRVIYNKRFSPW